MITSDVCEPHSVSLADAMSIHDTGDLFELIKKKIGVKIPAVLLFMTFQYFGISQAKCNDFFKNIGPLTSETAHKWASTFLLNDFDELIMEGRGGKHVSSFYDVFSDIEAFELARFIDDEFYRLTGIKKGSNDGLIRSVESCRLDLRKWVLGSNLIHNDPTSKVMNDRMWSNIERNF